MTNKGFLVFSVAFWVVVLWVLFGIPADAEEHKPKVTIQPFDANMETAINAARYNLDYVVDDFTGAERWEYRIGESELREAVQHEATLLPLIVRSGGVTILRMDYYRWGNEWLFPDSVRFLVERDGEEFRLFVPMGAYDEYTLASDSVIMDDGILYEWGYYALAIQSADESFALLDNLALDQLATGPIRARLDGCSTPEQTTTDVYCCPAAWRSVLSFYMELTDGV